ncbi:sphingolipid 4-desaturase/C4-monooxygenase [Alternaria panax]|uniref:Sphingolipid 4-desaturase/C4-monooxygenase n=1 Tax=Alternaria panax TaxID=48097 RepID=A0AAD4I6A2_9PLEO|nr:sphingolipid 4-desaturase/C4-monooxygenase [Alternaria panax]
MDHIEDTFYSEKEIAIEPDLGDLRKSTDKALPAPPKTPKRVLMKYRFSAVFPIAFAVASFVFSLVLVLAESDENTFGGQYMVALNTSAEGQESSQLDATSARSAGADGAVLADVYYLYLRTICSGFILNTSDDASNVVVVERCESYSEASDRLLTLSTPSGTSEDSLSPYNLVSTLLKTMTTILAGVRQAVFASLLVSLVGTGFSAVSALPAIFFPHSQLLAYFNIFWPLLASVFAFVAAVLLTVVVSGVFSVAGEIVDVAGTEVHQGASVTKLCGPEPLTKYVVLLVVSVQVLCAYLLRDTPVISWPFFLTAYIVGATASQNLFLAIHEISHNLAFRSPLANRIFAVFANLPIGIPYSASFRPYHLAHHKSLGVNGIDTDLPTAFEAIFLDSVAGKAFFATFQILFYALRPMFVYALPITKIHLFNIVIQLAFDYALVRFAGGRALGYLIMSSFLAGSLHPCAGHFIAEHYVFEKPNKDAANPANKIPLPETYSYYGPLNLLTYNVGLHNEHHDFPAIPWTRLHALNRIAHDFYKDLPQHKSWVYVLWQFIWDKDISLWCRVKREKGGRRVGAGNGWKEEELGSNEKKGPIPGVL